MNAHHAVLLRDHLLRKFRAIKCWLSCLPDEREALAAFDPAAIRLIDAFLTELGHKQVAGKERTLPPADRRNRTAQAAKKVFAETV